MNKGIVSTLSEVCVLRLSYGRLVTVFFVHADTPAYEDDLHLHLATGLQ